MKPTPKPHDGSARTVAAAVSDVTTVRLDRTLTYRLHLLHKLSDQESQRIYPEVTGLSMSDGRCLTTVGTFEPLSVKDLAQLANLNKGQASRAAQSLVDQGLVLKADRPGDGRGVALTLTPAGRAVCEKAMLMVERRNDAIFGCLDEVEQMQLSRLLDRLIAHNQAGCNADKDADEANAEADTEVNAEVNTEGRHQSGQAQNASSAESLTDDSVMSA